MYNLNCSASTIDTKRCWASISVVHRWRQRVHVVEEKGCSVFSLVGCSGRKLGWYYTVVTAVWDNYKCRTQCMNVLFCLHSWMRTAGWLSATTRDVPDCVRRAVAPTAWHVTRHASASPPTSPSWPVDASPATAPLLRAKPRWRNTHRRRRRHQNGRLTKCRRKTLRGRRSTRRRRRPTTRRASPSTWRRATSADAISRSTDWRNIWPSARRCRRRSARCSIRWKCEPKERTKQVTSGTWTRSRKRWCHETLNVVSFVFHAKSLRW